MSQSLSFVLWYFVQAHILVILLVPQLLRRTTLTPRASNPSTAPPVTNHVPSIMRMCLVTPMQAHLVLTILSLRNALIEMLIHLLIFP